MNYQRYVGPAMFGLGAVAVLAVLGVPVLAFLPYLVFLACPLMMIFMMWGMGHGVASGRHGSHRHGNHRGDEGLDQSTSPDRLQR